MRNKAIYRKHLNIRNRDNRQGKVEQSKQLYDIKNKDKDNPIVIWIKYHMLRYL
jgi:hypothetical protein